MIFCFYLRGEKRKGKKTTVFSPLSLEQTKRALRYKFKQFNDMLRS